MGECNFDDLTGDSETSHHLHWKPILSELSGRGAEFSSDYSRDPELVKKQCVFVCVHMCVCVHARMCLYMYVCIYACMHMHAWELI